jgi:thiosulfate/3-mercaptopyruvate sulfurtransferase
MTIKTITTAELAQRLEDPTTVIMDIRPMTAYNGWRLQNEVRGGHIKGAIACPLSWIEAVAPAEVKQLLSSKGITADKKVVIYGYLSDDLATVTNRLDGSGYDNVLTYEAGLEGWATDESLPMEWLANYEKLVYPDWLRQLITEKESPTYAGNGFLVFHVTYGVPEEYTVSHIPGALHLDTHALESPPSWNRRPAHELEASLLAHGITHDKTVILYGRDTVADPDETKPGRHAGQIAATRAAAILMYAGVEDVRLLDGGYDGWVSAGFPVEVEEHQPQPVEEFGVQIPQRPDFIVDIDVAKDLIASPDGVLVSIRSWEEFLGNVSGYNYIGPRGRIAGAVWGNCGTDAYHMQHYRSLDNTMRDYHEIATNWQEVGITPDKRVAFYCGTGWRASETFFYAYLMGWERVAVYDGGWLEWSSDPANAIEIGEPERKYRV